MSQDNVLWCRWPIQIEFCNTLKRTYWEKGLKHIEFHVKNTTGTDVFYWLVLIRQTRCILKYLNMYVCKYTCRGPKHFLGQPASTFYGYLLLCPTFIKNRMFLIIAIHNSCSSYSINEIKIRDFFSLSLPFSVWGKNEHSA